MQNKTRVAALNFAIAIYPMKGTIPGDAMSRWILFLPIGRVTNPAAQTDLDSRVMNYAYARLRL